MSYFDTVDLFEDRFQFGQLECRVYRRFLELLRRDIWSYFLHTNKKHYQEFITSVGIDITVFKGPFFEDQNHVWGFIDFDTAEDYRRLEQQHSKFWPYFKFNELVIDFQTWKGKMMDRDPIPVPKVYRRVEAWNIKQAADMDYIAEAVHPGVKILYFSFCEMELEEAMNLVNYALTKIPGVPDYYFAIGTITDITEERIRQLFEPPPTTREMTLEITNTTVRYCQKEDI